MKKSLFLHILMSVLLLPLAFSSLHGQAVWNNLPLTGAEAKIIAEAKSPRFSASLTYNFSLGSVSSQNIPVADVQSAAFTPGAVEQLFEQLGGQFFIGNLSGQPSQSVEMNGQTQAMPGLRLGVRTGSRFEIRAGAQHFKSEWSGDFPIFVMPQFPHEPAQPKTLQGSTSASASGMLLDVETVFFVAGRGVVQPYLKGGLRGQFPMQSESAAEIAGVSLPLEVEPLTTEFSPFGGAGARLNFLKNAFVEAGLTYAKSAGRYSAEVGASLGWQF